MNTHGYVQSIAAELPRRLLESLPEDVQSRLGGQRQRTFIRQWEIILIEALPVSTPNEIAQRLLQTLPGALRSRLAGKRRKALRSRWVEMLVEVSPLRTPNLEVPAKIESTPAATWARDDWIQHLGPYVRAVRSRLFNEPTAPFSPDRWEAAVLWIQERHTQEQESRRQRLEKALESEEYRQRFARAYADTEWLSDRTGWPFVLEVAPPLPLAYKLPEEDHAGEDRVRVLHLYPDGGLFPLAQAGGIISDLTGFDPPTVTSWILAGEEPPLPRFHVRATLIERRLLGANLNDPEPHRAPKVSVDFLVDDLRHQDLRELHNAVRTAWRQIMERDPRILKAESRKRARLQGRELDEKRGLSVGPPPRPRLTPPDMALRAIIQKVGEPSRTSKLTWEEVRGHWEDAGHQPTSAEALRKRWERAKRKVENLHWSGVRGTGGSASTPEASDRNPDGSDPSGHSDPKGKE